MERVSDGDPGKPLSSRVPPMPHELLHPHWWIGSAAALGMVFFLNELIYLNGFFFERQEGVKLKMLQVSSHVKSPMSLNF